MLNSPPPGKLNCPQSAKTGMVSRMSFEKILSQCDIIKKGIHRNIQRKKEKMGKLTKLIYLADLQNLGVLWTN